MGRSPMRKRLTPISHVACSGIDIRGLGFVSPRLSSPHLGWLPDGRSQKPPSYSRLAVASHAGELPDTASGWTPMAQTALIYLIGLSGPHYVGRLDFELPLRVNDTNSFIHRQQRHVVHIDRIEPAYWSPNLESIPTVYVSAVTGLPKPGLRREENED